MSKLSSHIASLLVLICGMLNSWDGFAQETKMLHPNTPIKSLVFKQWTAEDGLISNNLTSVNVDRQGFLWLTFFNGAIKFDGNSMDLYDSENLPFLASNAFIDAFFKKDGTGWFSTQASGIVTYDRSFFSMPEFVNARRLPQYIRKVHVDDQDVIWAGSNALGLYKIVNNEVIQESFQDLRNVSIYDIAGDDDGPLYFATYGNGLVIQEKGVYSVRTEEDGLLSNYVTAIYISKNKNIYIGTSRGLNVIIDGQIQESTWFNGYEVNDIIEDGFGSIWVATEMGLGRFNNLFNVYEFYDTDDGLPSRQVSGLTFDLEGNLWVAMKKSGLIRLKSGSFRTYTQKDGLALDLVNIIVEADPDTYYVGSDVGGVNIIEHGIVKPFEMETDMEGNGIRDICFVNDEIWIASYNGIIVKNGSNEQIISTENGLPANDVRRIMKDSRGYIWVGSRSGGLVQLKDRKIENIYNKENGIKSNYILSLKEDDHGTIWVGTNGGGLSAIDINGHVTNYNLGGDISGILVFNIIIDETFTWLATNVGVFIFNGRDCTKVMLKSNFQNATFFDVLVDDGDAVWMTSNIGLYRVEKYDIDRFITGDLEMVPTRVFDHNDGLINKECTGATRALKASDGNLWIPTLGGVAIVNPSRINKNKYIPPVYITDFLTDRSGTFVSERLKDGKLNLDAGNLRYRIKFTALSYQSPEKVNFKYKLSGIDDDWVETVNEREVQYTNLPPGKYDFQVIASNNDLEWNNEGASFSFRIKPFLYQRLELYVGMFALVVVLAWLGYKRRVRVIERRNTELKRVNEELDKFVYSASHDLKAPLNSVLGLINIAKKDGPTGNMVLYLKLIEESILKLEQFITDIIDYSRNSSAAVNKTEIDFNKLVKGIFADLKYLDEENKIKEVVDIKGEGKFTTDMVRLSVVLNNLISNAFKYHDYKKENPFIKVTVKYTDTEANIVIQDNGPGIHPQHQKKIFTMFYRASEDKRGSGLGLYIVKETLEKIKGSIHLTSVPREGSTFTLTLSAL